jgi:hypothetical protein
MVEDMNEQAEVFLTGALSRENLDAVSLSSRRAAPTRVGPQRAVGRRSSRQATRSLADIQISYIEKKHSNTD